VAQTFVVYRIAGSRGADVLQALVGATVAGVLGSDRLPTYFKHGVGQRQLCWAHLTRNILSALDVATTPSARRFCRDVLVLQRRLFRVWHRFRGDPTARGAPLARAALIAQALPIEKAFFRLGERSLDATQADVRNLARALFVHYAHLFTFVTHEGVEPTNNAAERALRTAVQWRNTSFGTRSDTGEREVERLLTITQTCRLQDCSTLAPSSISRRRSPRIAAVTVASLLCRSQTP